MHNPWLTRYLIKELLTSHLAALKHLTSIGFYPEYGFRNFEQPYSTILSIVAGISFFVGLLLLLYYLVDHDRLGWASGVACYMVYHYILKARQVFFRAQMKRKVSKQIESLSLIEYEVSIEAYDPDTVMRRLESLETKGVFAFSTIFPLLRMMKDDWAASSI